MNKLIIVIGIFVVVALVGFFISTMTLPEDVVEEEQEEMVDIAKNWIYENSGTFIARGGENLEHVRTTKVDDEKYEITLTFTARFAGYGEMDEDEMAAQVITDHTVVVVIEEGRVISVVLNEEFAEMEEDSTDVIDEEEREEETISFNLYFFAVEDGVEEITMVERTVPHTLEVAREALLELLNGPNLEEKEEGLGTSLEGVTLNSVVIEDKIAYADFCEELNLLSGSATVTMARDQIEQTLLQFETIDDVVISVNGETEDVLQP